MYPDPDEEKQTGVNHESIRERLQLALSNVEDKDKFDNGRERESRYMSFSMKRPATVRTVSGRQTMVGGIHLEALSEQEIHLG